MKRLPIGSLLERFEAQRGPADGNGCRRWLGCYCHKYGQIRVAGKQEQAHRIAFLKANGYLPHIGRHSCDHPWCVEETHILDGTNYDNVQDRVRRGRNGAAHGERNGRAKVTREQAKEIRAARGIPRAIAYWYGISRTQVRHIKAGKHWK